jgi:hypothetical protein
MRLDWPERSDDICLLCGLHLRPYLNHSQEDTKKKGELKARPL